MKKRLQRVNIQDCFACREQNQLKDKRAVKCMKIYCVINIHSACHRRTHTHTMGQYGCVSMLLLVKYSSLTSQADNCRYGQLGLCLSRCISKLFFFFKLCSSTEGRDMLQIEATSQKTEFWLPHGHSQMVCSTHTHTLESHHSSSR